MPWRCFQIWICNRSDTSLDSSKIWIRFSKHAGNSLTSTPMYYSSSKEEPRSWRPESSKISWCGTGWKSRKTSSWFTIELIRQQRKVRMPSLWLRISKRSLTQRGLRTQDLSRSKSSSSVREIYSIVRTYSWPLKSEQLSSHTNWWPRARRKTSLKP